MSGALGTLRRGAVAVLVFVCAAPAARAVDVGGRIDDFTLPDVHGRDRSLAELADKSIVVVAFLGAECPLARLYAPRLQELSESYAERGVAFVGIDANQQDSLTDLGAFARTLQQGWEAKKRMASSISNPMIDGLEALAMTNGAVATKVSGAGGGGFMMFVCDPVDRIRLAAALSTQGGSLLDFHFNPGGATAWRTP